MSRTNRRQVYRALGVDIHRVKVIRGVSRITGSAVPIGSQQTAGRRVAGMTRDRLVIWASRINRRWFT